MNLFELITAQAIAAYWTETASNAIPYLGDAYFPARKQGGLDLSWVKGFTGLPIALKASAFDAKAPIRDRIGVTKIETEMPFFREAMTLKEKERQQILGMANSSESFWGPIINRIYDDRGQLIDGAIVQPERMRMQLLSTAKISIASNNLVYDYNYDPTGEYASNNMATVTNPWSDPINSTPITDLQNAMRDLEDLCGTRPSTAIMSLKTWSYLLASHQIKNDMNVLEGQKIILTDSMLQSYLVQKLQLQVIVYNKKFKDESQQTQQFYPDDQITLLPAGTLGNTWFGTTPEEADLSVGNTIADVAVVNTGIAVTTFVQPHPVNVQTIVSEIVLPSYERMDETMIIEVA